MTPLTTKFDLHLSAYQVAPDTIRKVEALGFKRDEFANNLRCDSTVYHGTFRGDRVLPDNVLWCELEDIFRGDPSFIGGLEEEEFEPAETVRFSGTGSRSPAIEEPLRMSKPSPGKYKACDIHININLSKTTPTALTFVEALELASFDKPEEDGIHRVFSATCESVESGKRLLNAMSSYLAQVPGLVGKIKFERTTRFLRSPADAPALPMTSDAELAAWFRQSKIGNP